MTTSQGGPQGRPDNHGQGASLQKVDRQAALAALRQPTGPAVDLQEISPVVATFREHLAQEQEANRRRVKAIATGFAITLLVLAIVPVFLAVKLAEISSSQTKAQQDAVAAQERLTKSVSDSVAALSENSKQLREEIARERQLLGAAITSPPPTIVVTAVVPVTVTAPAPVAAPAPRPVEIQPIAVTAPPVRLAPVEALGGISAPAVDAPPRRPEAAPPVRELNDNDLDRLLRKVEQDIKDRRAALERGHRSGP